MEKAEDTKHSRLEWLFYMILLPLLFTAILTAILLWFIGYDVKGILTRWGNSIPYVEKIVPGGPEGAPAASGEDELQMWKNKAAELNRKLQEQAKARDDAKQAVAEKDKQIRQLQQENELLKQMVEEEKERTRQEQDKEKELAELYSAMSPSKAAPILENLPMEQAVRILELIQPEERGNILAKIDPVIAAKITSILLNNP